jgi:putative (di)nucleoside polyphosphate hydrolase
MLLSSQNLVFAARRIDTEQEAWQMPQGGIDNGEAPQVAAMRELNEEIGTNDVDIIGESKEWLSYDFPENLARTLWGGQYHGQSQIWYAMRFQGRGQDIDLGSSGRPEFSDWRWMIPDPVPGSAWRTIFGFAHGTALPIMSAPDFQENRN